MTHKKTQNLPPILFLEILNLNKNPIFDKLIFTLPSTKPTKKSINTTLCSSILIHSQQFHNPQIVIFLYNNSSEEERIRRKRQREEREEDEEKEDETPEKRRVNMYLDLDAIEDDAYEEEDDEDGNISLHFYFF